MTETTTEPHPAGAARRFDYLFAGSDMLPEYNARHGQEATVVRPLIAGEEYDDEGDRMYRVRFADGFAGDVFECELREVAE